MASSKVKGFGYDVLKSAAYITIENPSVTIKNIKDYAEIDVVFIIEPSTNTFRKTAIHLPVNEITTDSQYIVNMTENENNVIYNAFCQFYFPSDTVLNIQGLRATGWGSETKFLIKVLGR